MKRKIKRKLKRRAIRTGVFLGSFALFSVMRTLLGGQSIQGFNLFSQWSTLQQSKMGGTYVKQSDVDNSAVGGVLAQIAMGNGSFSAPATSSNVYGLFATSQLLVNTDILTLVKNAENPDAAVDAHIAHTQATINEIQSTVANLNGRAQSHITRAKECLALKREGDQRFFIGVNQLDQGKSDAGLDQSLEYAPCYITHRIKANAYTYLAQKVQTNQSLLAQRAALLKSNKRLLVENSAYLEGDILEQLLQLKRNLLAVNTSTPYQGFQKLFDFTSLDADQPLPAYYKVLFRDNGMKIPTYQNPGIEVSLGS